jgi:hypothetical protein
MLPHWHALFGFVAAYIIAYFFNVPLVFAFVVFASSVLIDVDHYILYIYKTKNFSLKKSFNWATQKRAKWAKLSSKEKKQYKIEYFIFHGIEFLLILFLLSYFSVFFMWIAIGILIHLAADIPDLAYNHFPLYAKLSQLAVLQTNKNKKKLE